jgi:hypothetical protein
MVLSAFMFSVLTEPLTPCARFFCRLRRQARKRNWGHPKPRQGRCPLDPVHKNVHIGLTIYYMQGVKLLSIGSFRYFKKVDKYLRGKKA